MSEFNFNIKTSALTFSRSGICTHFVNALTPEESKIVLACSGGPDSAALIGAARVMVNRKLIKSADVVHINHHLRDEAQSDLEVCKRQSEIFNLPFYSYDIYPALHGGNIYKAARELRYSILQHHASNYGRHAILTAHHADDVAETILMHLTRGCGVDGLCGVRHRHSQLGEVDIVRPFLKLRKTKLETTCAKAHVPFCVDKSNFNMEKSRAYVRHAIIPALEKLNPSFVEHASKTAMIMQNLVDKNTTPKSKYGVGSVS